MNVSLSLAWLEMKALLRLPWTPLVFTLFLACALLSTAQALWTDVDSLAGSTTRWAAFHGPWLHLGFALLAVYAGSVGVARYREVADDTWRVMPMHRQNVMLSRLVGRMLFAVLVALLVVVPLGYLAGTEMMPAGARPGAVMPLVLTLLSTLIVLGYFVSGTFLLAVLLPKSSHAMLLALGLCAVWGGLAWVFPYTGYDVPDELIFWGMHGLNPFWLDRLVGLGVIALAPLLGALVGALAHTWMSLSCEPYVRYEYKPKRERSELTWDAWPLAWRIGAGHVVIVAVALGGSLLLGLHGPDTTEARVVQPGPHAAEVGSLLAQSDPISRLDAPLEAAYLWRLARAQEGAGAVLRSQWRPAPRNGAWQGVIRYDVAEPLGLDLHPDSHRPLSSETLEHYNDRYRARYDRLHADVSLAGVAVQGRIESVAASLRAHSLGMTESRLLAQGQPRPQVLLIGRRDGVGWMTLLRSEGYPVEPVAASAAAAQLEKAEPGRDLVVLALHHGDALPGEARTALAEFLRRGGSMFVSLVAPLPVDEEDNGEPSAEILPAHRLHGVLPPAPDALARFIERRGLRMAYAEFGLGTPEVPEARQVRTVLADGQARWRMVAGHEVLRTREHAGDTVVSLAVRPVALAAARLSDGTLAPEALPWRPLVQGTDEAVMQFYTQAGADDGDAVPVPATPTPVWWREGGSEGEGRMVVSALEPFTGADSRHGLRPLSGDERDVTANLLAWLAQRDESSRLQRRKPLSLDAVDDWQPGDWVALMAVTAYSIPLIGLIVGFKRLRGKRRRRQPPASRPVGSHATP